MTSASFFRAHLHRPVRSVLTMLMAGAAFCSMPGVDLPALAAPPTQGEIVPAADCAAMAARSFGPGRVLSAKLVADKDGHTQCEVTAVKQDRPGFLMRAQLPTRWTGDLVHGGGGGLDGVLPDHIWGTVQPGAAGMVYLVSNGGHVGQSIEDPSALANDPVARADYGWRAIGITDDFGDALVKAYYGQAALHRFFVGCSMGGFDALQAAAMFPERYDGIVAQAPTPHLDGWVARVGGYAQLAPLTDAKWASVYQAYINACDGLDGLADGVVNNLGACHFKASQVPGLTDAERATVEALTSDLKLKDGTVVYPRYWWGARFKFFNFVSTLGTAWMRQMIHDDPNFDPASFDLDREWPSIQAAMVPFHANIPASGIAAYLKAGKKLVIVLGADDAALPLVDMVRYHQEVAQKAGAAATNMKMYLMPGVSHCGFFPEGPQIRGAAAADMLGMARQWVDGGAPIPRPIALEQDSTGLPLRSRPLCEVGSYPRYDGKNDPDDETSFECAPEAEIEP